MTLSLSATVNISFNPYVAKCILYLKANKHDGLTGITSDHIINGTYPLFEAITKLMSTMMTHGYAPDGFRTATVLQIPKNKRKSLNLSDNYRGIALSSIIGKLFDWVVGSLISCR